MSSALCPCHRAGADADGIDDVVLCYRRLRGRRDCCHHHRCHTVIKEVKNLDPKTAGLAAQEGAIACCLLCVTAALTFILISGRVQPGSATRAGSRFVSACPPTYKPQASEPTTQISVYR